MRPDAIAKEIERFLVFVEAEHAGVDEDVGEAIADGAMNEGGGHGGIHAAAQGAEGAGVADLAADGGDGFVNEAGAAPIFCGAANFEDEIA